MGTTRSALDDATRQFIQAQSMFFVATAPLDPKGHLNVSPKGLDTLRILSPTTIAYLDLTGSGVETIAHLKENGRIVLMFCAFQGPPNIFRLYGRGRVIEPRDPDFNDWKTHFPEYESTRSIIVVELSAIRDSCGYGVPLLKYEAERPQLAAWARKKGAAGLEAYRREKNRRSLGGLPGIAE